MSEWTTATDRPGYRCKVIQRGRCTISIHRPEAAETARNESTARVALEATMRDYLQRRTSA